MRSSPFAVWLVAAACSLACAPTLSAQRRLPTILRARSVAPAAPSFTAPPPVSPPLIVGGALLGAAVGAVSGFFIGGSATRGDCNNPDACLDQAIPGFIWGTATGMTLGAPLGAHLANRRQGSLWKSALVSAALLGIETIAIRSMVEDGRTDHADAVIAIAVATPVLQIVASSVIEARTTP